MREHKIRIWNGEELLGPFDLTQNPKYWADKLQDGEITHYLNCKDVKGKEIYDGDLVQGFNRLWEVVVVENVHYWNGCYMFGNYNAHEFLNKHQHIEVIGNVYENKELLEEK